LPARLTRVPRFCRRQSRTRQTLPDTNPRLLICEHSASEGAIPKRSDGSAFPITARHWANSSVPTPATRQRHSESEWRPVFSRVPTLETRLHAAKNLSAAFGSLLAPDRVSRTGAGTPNPKRTRNEDGARAGFYARLVFTSVTRMTMRLPSALAARLIVSRVTETF
jgi:hypothetical protein